MKQKSIVLLVLIITSCFSFNSFADLVARDW